jgi:hypothetical protein
MKKINENGQELPKEENIKESESPIKESSKKVRCTCACHRQNGIVHISACCRDGYIDI